MEGGDRIEWMVAQYGQEKTNTMTKNILTILALTFSASAQIQTVNLALPVAPQPVLEKSAERSFQYDWTLSFAYGEEMKQVCVNVPSNRTMVLEYVSSQARGWRSGAGMPTPLQSFPGEFTLGISTNNSTSESYVPYTQLFKWHPDYSGYLAGQQVKLYSKPGTKMCAVVRRYTESSNAEVKVLLTGFLLEP